MRSLASILPVHIKAHPPVTFSRRGGDVVHAQQVNASWEKEPTYDCPSDRSFLASPVEAIEAPVELKKGRGKGGILNLPSQLFTHPIFHPR